MLKIDDTQNHKIVWSEDYNIFFNKKNGRMMRYGHTKDDDPDYAPMPEILDIEISTGVCKGKCPQCYKKGGRPCTPTKHMSLDTFKCIMDKFMYNEKSSYLTQIALGLTDTTSNPDFWNILEETKRRGIVPNFTTHGLDITPEIAKRVSKLCGAVAVSIVNMQKTYDAVKMFTDAGMTQINIHLVIYKERIRLIKKIIHDIKNDERLKKLNALVLLTYKPKGAGIGRFTNLTYDEFSSIIQLCEESKIRYGMDSCSCTMYERWLRDNRKEELLQYCEPCESGCFSCYINVRGEYWPCSFSEGENGQHGISVIDCGHFSDIWNSEQNLGWRHKLLCNGRSCPLFKLENKE